MMNGLRQAQPPEMGATRKGLGIYGGKSEWRNERVPKGHINPTRSAGIQNEKL
jgi:hypothetical protein